MRQFQYNFTLDNSNHALSARQVRKKKQQCTEVRTFNLSIKQQCQFFVFTFMSLQFKFSVHSCILIKLCCLIFFKIYISCCPKCEVCMILASPLPFAYFLISVHLLRTPDNSNSVLVTRTFFNFRTRFELSGVDYIIVA